MILTILSLVVGYLTLSASVALLYATWFSSSGHEITHLFLAISSICSLGFSTLSGYLTALIAQRAPIAHASGLAILLILVWSVSTFTTESVEPLSIALLNVAIGISGVMAGGWWRQQQCNTQNPK